LKAEFNGIVTAAVFRAATVAVVGRVDWKLGLPVMPRLSRATVPL
jgi:hypothetical protein